VTRHPFRPMLSLVCLSSFTLTFGLLNFPLVSNKLSKVIYSINSSHISIYHIQTFEPQNQNTIWSSRPLQAIPPPPKHFSSHLETIAKRIKLIRPLFRSNYKFEVCIFRTFLAKPTGQRTHIYEVNLVPMCSLLQTQQF
jgi:hypothetical protein